MKTIDKEIISTLYFPKDEILIDPLEKAELRRNLKSAISLGNTQYHKIKILFEDVEGEKIVYTTIWGITDDMVILKRNNIIPIHRIKQIQLL